MSTGWVSETNTKKEAFSFSGTLSGMSFIWQINPPLPQRSVTYVVYLLKGAVRSFGEAILNKRERSFMPKQTK